ncbi:hypothetical protein BRC81_04160 [Halobacteriales archaeon QS_1_68_20]|nr:MAG: hypothetical protein BRC81_04160 [Halobacteriales archaeon QS_1_68_20]
MAGGPWRRVRRARFRRWFGVHFALAVALFVLGALGGYAVAEPGLFRSTVGVGSESVFPERITTWTVFLNNVVAVGVTGLGLVSLGLVAAFSVTLNGFVVGLVLGLRAPDVSTTTALALILPHGVIELTAFFLVAAITFRVNHRLARYLAGYDETALTRQELFEAGVLFVAAVAMIAVAAWIEVNVTPVVGEFAT